MMEEWKEYKLGDVISIKSGFAYKGDMIGRGEGVLLGMGLRGVEKLMKRLKDIGVIVRQGRWKNGLWVINK